MAPSLIERQNLLNILLFQQQNCILIKNNCPSYKNKKNANYASKKYFHLKVYAYTFVLTD